MQLTRKKLSEITPYERNPRKNDQAVDAVAESIRQCGYVAPIIVDEDGIILAGHTRYKALKKLGMEDAEVVVREGLTEYQKRKYRLLDNKTGEIAEWDFELLEKELEGLDFAALELDWGLDEEAEVEKEEEPFYTQKTQIPQYTPTANPPELIECYNKEKYEELLDKINASNVGDQEKQMLTLAAARHLRFNYKKLADYYASASHEMQCLMEDSALVIIDINDAIAKGFAVLQSKLLNMAQEDFNG